LTAIARKMAERDPLRNTILEDAHQVVLLQIVRE
jgi:hypothetical protein